MTADPRSLLAAALSEAWGFPPGSGANERWLRQLGSTPSGAALLAAAGTADRVEALRPLSDAATPGPWVSFGGYDGGHTIAEMRSTDRTWSVGLPGPLSGAGHQPPERMALTWDRPEANAALIAAAVGLVRELLDGARPAAGCTPTEARWCPLHGDCTCLADDGWDEDQDHDDCPLHAPASPHGATIDPAWETTLS